MASTALVRYRAAIAAKLKELRRGRLWTQSELARILGVSQTWLSDIERGKGSLSAEQLLLILGTFNVTADVFAPVRRASTRQIQNALARLGASHLQESSDALPTDRLREARDVLRETLIGAESPRYISALAPVIVNQIHALNLGKLKAEFAELGFERRFAWLLESTAKSLEGEKPKVFLGRWDTHYERAATAIHSILEPWPLPAADTPEDVLDSDIVTEKTIAQVREESSDVSRRWRIITRIQTGDFVDALRSVREGH